MGEGADERERRAAAVGVVDADAVGRPARRAGAATRAEAAHAMAGDVDERGQVAAVRGADGEREPVGRGGHGAPHALAQAQRMLLGLARALAHDVQAPRRADPRARRGIEGGARGALDLHAAQQLGAAGGHHRDAPAGQDHGRQRPLARERQRARRPAQPARGGGWPASARRGRRAAARRPRRRSPRPVRRRSPPPGPRGRE